MLLLLFTLSSAPVSPIGGHAKDLARRRTYQPDPWLVEDEEEAILLLMEALL